MPFSWIERVALHLRHTGKAMHVGQIGRCFMAPDSPDNMWDALRSSGLFVEINPNLFRVHAEAALPDAAAVAAMDAADDAAEKQRADAAAKATAAVERRRAAARARYAKKKAEEAGEGGEGVKKKRKEKPVVFKPAQTGFRAPDVCFEVVLNNMAAAAWLRSWRWLFLLPQVCHAWRAAFNPNEWIHWACIKDSERLIWKAKAMHLFRLTRQELEDLPFERKEYGGHRYTKEVHLLHRRHVLHLAMAKHGNSVAAIAAAFNSKKRRIMRDVPRC